MKRTLVVLQVALLLTSACCAQAQESAQTAKQEKLGRQISDLQHQVDALLKGQEFALASDELERLQMLYMDAGRYQEALNASFKIEEISPKVSKRRTPWNYVRIAEVYRRLGDPDRYFEWMEKAVHERGFYRLEYLQDGHLNALKDDPRYDKLIDACAKEIGLGQKAKDFRITLLDGSSFTLSAQTGKVVLVDFWDVRCPPCRREMPNLKELFKDLRDEGLEIVGISLDTDRALPALRWVKAARLVVCGLFGSPSFAADVPRETELLNAVKFGHLATVDELLEAVVPADAEVGRMSALWIAATVGNDAIVERLLAAGAAPDRMNRSSAQPEPRWNQRPMVAHPGLY